MILIPKDLQYKNKSFLLRSFPCAAQTTLLRSIRSTWSSDDGAQSRLKTFTRCKFVCQNDNRANYSIPRDVKLSHDERFGKNSKRWWDLIQHIPGPESRLLPRSHERTFFAHGTSNHFRLMKRSFHRNNFVVNIYEYIMTLLPKDLQYKTKSFLRSFPCAPQTTLLAFGEYTELG